MRKKSILLSLLLFGNANASTQVYWDMPNIVDEVFKIDNVTPLSANSVWQLIWTPDGVISSFNSANPFEVDSSEVVMFEFNNPNGSYVLGETVNEASDVYVGGYVYTRVFDYTGATSGFNLVDLDGMMYAESGVSGQLEKIDAVPAGSITTHNPFAGPTVVDQTFHVVPEPASIAFLLMGFGGLVGFRKRKR